MKDNAENIAAGAVNEAESFIWSDPLPLKDELLPVDPFNAAALLPDVLRDWIMDVANRMPCPPDFVAAAAMVALGSVIGARCVIKPKQYDDWTIVPNLWGGIVGLPSSKKSPAISEALKPLDKLMAIAREAHEKEMADYQTQKMLSDATHEALESELKKAAKTEIKK